MNESGANEKPAADSAPQESTSGDELSLRSIFSMMDQDDSGLIGAVELQKALINGEWSPFDIETIQYFMLICDMDGDGAIGFDEFAGLWRTIHRWQVVFNKHDRDGSGAINNEELAAALSQNGYNFSMDLIQLLTKKYASSTRGIPFDRFIRVCIVVALLEDSFRELKPEEDGRVHINRDQFITAILSIGGGFFSTSII